MVDFHCELFDRCINHSDDKEDDSDNEDLKLSKDAKSFMKTTKKVHLPTLPDINNRTRDLRSAFFFNFLKN